jgi:hypothetical protein
MNSYLPSIDHRCLCVTSKEMAEESNENFKLIHIAQSISRTDDEWMEHWPSIGSPDHGTCVHSNYSRVSPIPSTLWLCAVSSLAATFTPTSTRLWACASVMRHSRYSIAGFGVCSLAFLDPLTIHPTQHVQQPPAFPALLRQPTAVDPEHYHVYLGM